MPDSKCQTVLITGASAGIGAALAKEFAAHGHELILVARRTDKLQALAKALADQHGTTSHCIPADLTDTDAAKQLFDEVSKRKLAVDVLVNNAGLAYEGHFGSADVDELMAMLQLNVVALTALSRLFLGPMLARKQGRILNLASISAFQPVPTIATYAATKAYVLSITESLAAELAGTGVTATALCPGFTETDMITRDDSSKLSLPLIPNMTAEQVAKEGYAALMKGQDVHVNGVANRLVTSLGRFQPRALKRMLNKEVARRGF